MLGTKFYRDYIHNMYWNLSSANYRVDGSILNIKSRDTTTGLNTYLHQKHDFDAVTLIRDQVAGSARNCV